MVELVGIKHGDIAPDITALLKATYAFEHGGRRQMDPDRNLFGRQSGIVLKDAQDVKVCGIQSIVLFHNDVDRINFCQQ